jgi:hypothetical protein
VHRQARDPVAGQHLVADPERGPDRGVSVVSQAGFVVGDGGEQLALSAVHGGQARNEWVPAGSMWMR